MEAQPGDLRRADSPIERWEVYDGVHWQETDRPYGGRNPRPSDECVPINPTEPFQCHRGNCHASYYSHSDERGCSLCTCPAFLGIGPNGPVNMTPPEATGKRTLTIELDAQQYDALAQIARYEEQQPADYAKGALLRHLQTWNMREVTAALRAQ